MTLPRLPAPAPGMSGRTPAPLRLALALLALPFLLLGAMGVGAMNLWAWLLEILRGCPAAPTGPHSPHATLPPARPVPPARLPPVTPDGHAAPGE